MQLLLFHYFLLLNHHQGIYFDGPIKIKEFKSKDYIQNVFYNKNKTSFVISEINKNNFLPMTRIQSDYDNKIYQWNDTTALECFHSHNYFRLNKYGIGSAFEFNFSKNDFITASNYNVDIGIFITFNNHLYIFNALCHKKFENLIHKQFLFAEKIETFKDNGPLLCLIQFKHGGFLFLKFIEQDKDIIVLENSLFPIKNNIKFFGILNTNLIYIVDENNFLYLYNTNFSLNKKLKINRDYVKIIKINDYFLALHKIKQRYEILKIKF